MSRMDNLFRKISGDLNKKLEGTNQLVLIEGVSTKWYKERSSITCFNLEFFHQSLKHDTMDTINVSKYFAKVGAGFQAKFARSVTHASRIK